MHTLYGRGVQAWIIFLYYGFIRVNKFKILGIELTDFIDFCSEHNNFINYSFPTINELESLRNKDNLSKEFYCNEFQRVSNCCIATVNGKLAYIHWIYLSGDFSRFLRLDNNSAEINYILTLPEYRGNNLLVGALNYTMSKLKKRGIHNVYCAIHEENHACIKLFQRVGFKEIANVYSFGHLNRKIKI